MHFGQKMRLLAHLISQAKCCHLYTSYKSLINMTTDEERLTVVNVVALMLWRL